MVENNLQITTQDFLIYSDDSNEVKVNVMLINRDLWLTQNLMAKLFDKDVKTISRHIINIYKEGELSEKSNSQKTRIANSDKPVTIYNLNTIISVGFRVNSKKATQFRIWANKTLQEYIIKGFVMDDERLKNPNYIFGEDYFEEQLERIRNIRSSERRFYQKITDIYAQCSIDYDSNSEITRKFFKIVQNKMHYATSGQTAAEIVHSRVNSENPNMGLTSWKKSPKGPIYKSDVDIAKNYLNEKELDGLNKIVTAYLDFAELQATHHNAMTMNDWIERLDGFLKLSDREILDNAGKISHEAAQLLAFQEYDKYQAKQDKLYHSDFDKYLEELDDK